MQYLPPLRSDSAVWCLPLSEGTANVLVNALLSESRDEVVSCLELAVRYDPAFALWTVCCAGEGPGEALGTVSSVASWLATNLLDTLNWESSVPASVVRSEEGFQQWRELAIHGISNALDRSEELYLIYLIMDAECWLTTCGPTIGWQDVLAGRSCLPRWLVRRLATSRETASCEKRDPRPARASDVMDVWSAEVSDVGRSLVTLVRKLQRLQKLESEFAKTVEREKLDSLKQFAYGAGHEINNPLANISTRAQTLLSDEEDPERRRKLVTINSQAFRAHEMIADLMLFAKPPKLVRERVNLDQLIGSILDELSVQAKMYETRFHYVATVSDPLIWVDPDQIGVALRAICTNSMEAIGHGGTIDVLLRDGEPITDIAERTVEILICDTGPGVSPEIRQHLFDPFFSGREAGRGLGFGLSKCWRIVTDHGGSIIVDNRVGQGATFTVVLPSDRESD